MGRLSWVFACGMAACGSVDSGVRPDGATADDGGFADGQPVKDAGPDAMVSPGGELRWVRSLSSMSVYGVAEGPAGVVVAGSMTAPADLGGGALIPQGASDLVVASYASADAAFLYAVRHGATGSGQGYGFLDDTDATGNPLVHGVSYGPSVDLGKGVVNGGGGEGADGYIGRYGPGQPAWILRAVGPGDDKILATAPAPGGKLYAGGFFEQTIDFAGQSYTSNGGRDILLGRLNTFTGATDLVRQLGGAGRDELSDAAGDGTHLVLAGFFDATLSFGNNVAVTAAGGGLDLWVAGLDGDAQPVWAKSFGGSGDDRGTLVAVDGQGDVYVAAQFRNQIALGAVNLTSKGQGDIVVAKLHGADGSVAWAISMGSVGDDGPFELVADDHGRLFLGAGLGAALEGESSLGGTDAMIVSLDAAGNGALRWRKIISTPGAEFGQSLAIGLDGDVLAALNLGGAFDFGVPIVGPPSPAAVLLRIAP